MWKWLSRRQTEPDTAEVERSRIAILFNHFRRILELNNSVLGAMTAMEHSLGGEYIFDNAFLDSSVREITAQVHHVIYSLNALTQNNHIPLYDRFQDIRTVLDGILSGGPGPHAETVVLPFDDLGWEMEPLAGIEPVCQAELRHHSGLPVADGFVLTVVGARIWQGLSPGFDLRQDSLPTQGDLRVAITAEAQRLVHARNAPDLLTLRLVSALAPGEQQAAGQDTLPETTVPWSKVTDALDQLLGTLQPDSPPVAVVINCAHPMTLQGMVRTRDLESGRQDALRITAELLTGTSRQNRFLVRRAYPFDLIRSRLDPLPMEDRLPDGQRTYNPGRKNLLRGSALIDTTSLHSLAETAMTLERMLGMPAELHWSMRENGTIVINRLRPLPHLESAEPGPELLQEIEAATTLCQGGRPVQAGIAAGRVVHVTDAMPAEQFPPGAVAVAKGASPRLTPILHKAAAVITELGTPAGHLAAVARELRLPAVFGMPDALQLLPPGQEITLDAAETKVYQGVQDGMLRWGWGAELYPTDPEYHTLRRLLRFIRPLNLTDPQAANFSPDGCRTLHDIIHYCHEMAVEELATFQQRRPGLGNLRARPLNTGLPMPIRVLDIGGGLSEEAMAQPGFEDVRSQPLAAFLSGLREPGAWSTNAASLRLRDVFASVPRTMGQLNAPPSDLGDNLAIIGLDYMNLSLRLGYHFSVVDAYLGPDPDRSHVYFRFAGGLADPTKRARRARLIRDVLEALDFSTEIKDDLVVGSLKQVEPAVSSAALSTLGSLTAFVRQRDTSMNSDEAEQQLFDDFEQAFLRRTTSTLE